MSFVGGGILSDAPGLEESDDGGDMLDDVPEDGDAGVDGEVLGDIDLDDDDEGDGVTTGGVVPDEVLDSRWQPAKPRARPVHSSATKVLLMVISRRSRKEGTPVHLAGSVPWKRRQRAPGIKKLCF